MNLAKYLAHLGYGSRREVMALMRQGRVTDQAGATVDESTPVVHDAILIDGQPLDPAPGVVLMLHKPTGYTCSTTDPGSIVYDLLPARFRLRDPVIAPVGRLDRDTSGLLLLTDDGGLLHRLTSPQSHVPKVYDVRLAQKLRGDEVDLFASGTLVLRSETTALSPAALEVLAPEHARLTITEGRYHQVRRMFAAAGNRVTALHRVSIGRVVLGDLRAGQWRILAGEEIDSLSNTSRAVP